MPWHMYVKADSKGQVLVAEMRDVRPFARLLRGIGIKHVRPPHSRGDSRID